MNLELFSVHKMVSEYVERIYAYKEKTPKRHKTVYISVNNNNTNLIFFILSIYTIWNELSLKNISHHCPFNRKISFVLTRQLDCGRRIRMSVDSMMWSMKWNPNSSGSRGKRSSRSVREMAFEQWASHKINN